MGKVVVLVGIQKGDEGKGSVSDEFGGEVDVFIRFQGGANAGHTIYVGGQKMVAHLLPCGVIYPQAQCILGNDMVIDPIALGQELAEVTQRGLMHCKRLGISRLASLVMPYCQELDKLREQARGKSAIGTTGRGIGPAYEMRARRLALRVGDLLHLGGIGDYVDTIVTALNPEIVALGGKVLTRADIFYFLEQARDILGPYILAEPVSKIVCQAKADGQNVLIEGAQGTELDLTHGTFPYVTSSSTIAGAACSGAGIGPRMIDAVIGVCKAYDTRVGGGPFPTELDGEVAEQIRKRGNEFGATTGRPRSVGWFDAPQVRHAVRVNGLTGLVVTKLDVLRGMDMQYCDYYNSGGRAVWDMDDIDSCQLSAVRPSYQPAGRFDQDISGCRQFGQLPKTAQMLLTSIADVAGVPLVAISVGPERGQTIVMSNPWA